ncbi:MAG: SGNH/GDSL hydrolase family protein [Planctomycetaceae bacterium]
MRRRSTWQAFLIALATTLFLSAMHPARMRAAEPVEHGFPLDAGRIVFLGDSITHAGRYIAEIELRLREAGVEPLPELINLGLPSETASGLSEPGHPFPRPCIHTRLDAALEQSRPDVVVLCYGMNDGIYFPFSEERFATYRDGMDRLIAKCQAAGAEVILLTPPPFDPLPIAAKLRKEGEGEFGFKYMFADYDDVLAKYAESVLARRDDVRMVIDIRTPIVQYVAQMRETDPQFTHAGDGVHPNAAGHHLIAAAILAAWGIEPAGDMDEAAFRLVMERQTVLHDAWLSHVGHERPGMKAGLPLDEANQRAANLDQQIVEHLRQSSKPQPQ